MDDESEDKQSFNLNDVVVHTRQIKEYIQTNESMVNSSLVPT